MDRITLIGLFCHGQNAADGQSIKTRIVAQELAQRLPESDVRTVDTFNWKKHPLKLFWNSIHAVWRSRHVIFMIDEGGIKVFPWLLTLANLFRQSKIHYVVIGGWLPESLKTRPLRRFWLHRLDGIYVETMTMKTSMENQGFSNVVLLPNCKKLSILSQSDLPAETNEPYPLCTFSRVMREKGIEDAVHAVDEINRRNGRLVYTLDIYGQVDKNQHEWFENLKANFPNGVRYGGIIPYDQSTAVLRKYFALLFPTKLFYIEGVPGTIIDAYAAGLPIIASRWLSCCDIIDTDTSIIYSAGSYEELAASLDAVAGNPALISTKRAACLQRAQLYTTEHVMQVLLEHLRD